jgi:hypothetical protein
MQTIQFFRNRCTSKVPLQDFDFAPLSRDAIFRISRALGQQRPLARGFDKILERLLVSLELLHKWKLLAVEFSIMEFCSDVTNLKLCRWVTLIYDPNLLSDDLALDFPLLCYCCQATNISITVL